VKTSAIRLAVAGAFYLAGLHTAAPADGPITLRDVTNQTGITFRHTDGGSGRHYIAETVTAGVATFDFDDDGLIDIYFLNGHPLKGNPSTDSATNALYRNTGSLQFSDVSYQAGVADNGYGMGVAIGDFDNDRHPDIFCNNFGPNVLYRNNGDGTFSEVTNRAGVGGGNFLGAGVNFLDIEADGDLDLFVSDYVDFTYENHRTATIRGRSNYAGPRDYDPQPNHLYRNNGDGTFTDRSEASGIGDHPGSGMGTVCLDYDQDGRTDIFVCNDQRWDSLFHNEGAGTFSEVGLLAGVACNFSGGPTGSMGADAGDFDNDGRLDLIVTDYFNESSVLHHNLGDGQFEDVSAQARVGVGAMAYVKWGCGFVDFDNDGFRDIFIGCGHIYKDIDTVTEWTSYEVLPVLFHNQGDGRFANVSDRSGDGLKVKMVARGIAFDDLDNDGRVDVVVSNRDRPPTVLRNETENGHHWLQIRLRGVDTNAQAVGAQVTVVAGDLTQVAEVHSGRGYQSHFGTRLHFGLGPRNHVDRIEVRWIGDTTDVLEDVPVDRRMTICQGAADESE
jgi:hypothetical protein